MKWTVVYKPGTFHTMPFSVCEFSQVWFALSLWSWRTASLDFHTLPSSLNVYFLTLRGHLSLLKKTTKERATDHWIPTSYQALLLYIWFCEILTTTMIDTIEAQGGDALQLKLPGFIVRMWVGPADSLYDKCLCCLRSRGRFCSGDAPNHTACCPSLNSEAQPWTLPGCNHSPGGAIFNSSLTTKALSLFLTGQEDEPHLPFQGAESMITTTRETIGWHVGHSFPKSPVILPQRGQASRHGIWSKSSRAPEAGDRMAMNKGACQLGQGVYRCNSEKSYFYTNIHTVILCL